MEKQIPTGRQLCETRWGISELTLREYIRNGLPAYRSNGETGTLTPFNGRYQWQTEAPRSWASQRNPDLWPPPPPVTYEITAWNLCFKLSAVEEFERKHPEIERKDLDQRESAKDKEICQKQAKGLHKIHLDWRRDELAANLSVMQPGCNYDAPTLKRWISEAGLELKAGRGKKTKEKKN